ncbi:hypothetical protein V8G54_001280 [Vigna mungo]|uniref:Uncharacterized protein n=1 Tax=Vigna mungo TaxID=3915 RepID=A0AAQ3P635_VIGMU
MYGAGSDPTKPTATGFPVNYSTSTTYTTNDSSSYAPPAPPQPKPIVEWSTGLCDCFSDCGNWDPHVRNCLCLLLTPIEFNTIYVPWGSVYACLLCDVLCLHILVLLPIQDEKTAWFKGKWLYGLLDSLLLRALRSLSRVSATKSGSGHDCCNSSISGTEHEPLK